MGMIFKKISSSFVILNILHIVQCIELNETLITQRHRQRYTIDDLLHQTFESWISGDIDMDPCKSGGFLGDIALPNVNYETEWQRQKLNKTFQQEMERLKQEVYHEGLQVEEEGLTDIVRKKTKQPVMVEYTTTYDKKLNDPMLELNGNGATLKENPYQNVPDSNNDNNDIYSVEINATIIDNNDNIIIKNITNNSNDTFDSKKDTASMKKDIKNMTRNIDRNKIQSNTKDIIDDSGDNIIYNKRISIVTVTQPSVQLHRTTIPNRFSNSGGNGGSLDNVKILTADGAVETFSNHKRHRRRRQDKNHSKDKTNYEARLARLKTELSRSTLSQNDPHVKTATITENTKNKIRRDKSKNNKNKKNKNSKIITTIPTPTVNLNFGPVEGERTHRVTRAATAKKERIWDYGVIPYEIDGNFSGLHKALFKQAMRHWENFTCIKFVERNPIEHPNYIVFTERPCGCCSFVGKRGNGPQAISIGKNCDKFGIVVHELGHVVGFWHEHTRPDRENHVVIEKNNIMSGQEYNFNKLTEEEVNSLGLPYDYDSIMHYARNTFSKGTYLDTIFPIEIPGRKRPEIGQRVRLSEGDIAQANLLYKCYKCGRTFQDNAGSFTSPSYHSPSATMEPERCEWRITATHGERIILNITDLDIYKSNNCRSDYLEIRDGYWHKSPVLGKFCGSGKVNDLIKSTGSRMLLTYITTYRQYGMRGFSASYEAVCGGEITLENEARLESPNYPLEYLPNKECIWRITVPEDYQVALKFQSFEVENHDTCMYDYVEVRDGDSPDSRLIGVFCGYKVPPDMRSSSNHLFVKFVSDGSVQKAGFSATLLQEVDECEHMDHGCEQECINTLGGYECACELGYELHSDKKSCENACGGVLDSLNGTILSPSFPKEYPILKECVWEIIAPKQHKITLNFTHFDLEGNTFYQASECEYDSVTIYSKMGEGNLKRHGAFCGTKLPPPITSEGNALRVEFKSDKTVQKTGFAAVFFTDIDECAVNNGGCQHDCKNTIGSYACSCHNGFTLHPNGHDCKEGGCKYEVSVPHGQIFSPNYPDYYPPMKDCIWHFTTTPGHRIRLVFNVFDIEPHQECAYDHIVIYDGSSPESSILGRFCGAKTPHPISSTSNEMYMNFKTDSSVQRKGFFASHTTACGGHLPASHRVKHLYSHAKYGDSMYDNGVDCEWTIEADQGMNVELKFLTFEIEEENSCSYDYVEVYGGLDDSSGPLHGKYCGNNNPPEIISMNEAILIRFRSDDTVGFKGFSASYVAVSPFDEFEEESESAEITPFPGSLKNMYIKRKNIHDEDDYEEEEDHGTFSQPHPRSRIKNTVRNSIGRSSQVVD